MNVRRWKSRRRNGYRGMKNTQSKLLCIVLVLALSVIAGYFTATYLLGPAMGLKTQTNLMDLTNEKEKNVETKTVQETTQEDKATVVEDQVGKKKEQKTGYALQYGSFSTKIAAEASAAELERTGIETEIIEKDGAYKVIGKLFDTEAEARTQLEEQKGLVDVFITQLP